MSFEFYLGLFKNPNFHMVYLQNLSEPKYKFLQVVL